MPGGHHRQQEARFPNLRLRDEEVEALRPQQAIPGPGERAEVDDFALGDADTPRGSSGHRFGQVGTEISVSDVSINAQVAGQVPHSRKPVGLGFVGDDLMGSVLEPVQGFLKR